MRVLQFTERLNFGRLPYALIGIGVVLSGVLITEVIVTARSPAPFTIVFSANALTTVPFLAMLVGGGYWLLQSDLLVDRYPRIAGWTVGWFVFMTGFFAITALVQESVLVQIQIIRWAAAIGAGSGMLVGIFEARAIDRAVAAERTRLRNEELRRKNERLEEFGDILSHDLRNPLNVAQGTVVLLRKEYDEESVERVATALDRMDQIIDDSLTLARSGQTIDEPEAVSLADLVDQAWGNVETEGATVETVDTATIIADMSRLQNLFENLFRNAVEHASTDMTVRVGTLPNGFYVEDDGPGIPRDDREAVLESGYSMKEDGTGFGLAIVREIADAHGWVVSVTDGTDDGARFEFTGVDTEQSTTAETGDSKVTLQS